MADKIIAITFANQAAAPVRVIWVHPDGHELLYRILAPGERYVQQSSAAQVWLVRGLGAGAPLETYTADALAQQVCVISGATEGSGPHQEL
jgi:hypothetical protein